MYGDLFSGRWKLFWKACFRADARAGLHVHSLDAARLRRQRREEAEGLQVRAVVRERRRPAREAGEQQARRGQLVLAEGVPALAFLNTYRSLVHELCAVSAFVFFLHCFPQVGPHQ